MKTAFIKYAPGDLIYYFDLHGCLKHFVVDTVTLTANNMTLYYDKTRSQSCAEDDALTIDEAVDKLYQLNQELEDEINNQNNDSRIKESAS